MSRVISILVSIALIASIGCQQKEAGQRTGERVDEIVDNVVSGDAPFKKKGAIEKTGEAIDEAISGD